MGKPGTIDEYLSGVEPRKRIELERIRRIVHDEVPEATEAIAYAMPGVRLDGRYLLGFAATKAGCSFYPGRLPADLAAGELARYRLWKGTINYDCAAPLEEALVRALVRARVAQLRTAA